jgi:hypothetical protein
MHVDWYRYTLWYFLIKRLEISSLENTLQFKCGILSCEENPQKVALCHCLSTYESKTTINAINFIMRSVSPECQSSTFRWHIILSVEEHVPNVATLLSCSDSQPKKSRAGERGNIHTRTFVWTHKNIIANVYVSTLSFYTLIARYLIWFVKKWKLNFSLLTLGRCTTRIFGVGSKYFSNIKKWG